MMSSQSLPPEVGIPISLNDHNGPFRLDDILSDALDIGFRVSYLAWP